MRELLGALGFKMNIFWPHKKRGLERCSQRVQIVDHDTMLFHYFFSSKVVFLIIPDEANLLLFLERSSCWPKSKWPRFSLESRHELVQVLLVLLKLDGYFSVDFIPASLNF